MNRDYNFTNKKAKHIKKINRLNIESDDYNINLITLFFFSNDVFFFVFKRLRATISTFFL